MEAVMEPLGMCGTPLLLAKELMVQVQVDRQEQVHVGVTCLASRPGPSLVETRPSQYWILHIFCAVRPGAHVSGKKVHAWEENRCL